MTRAPFTITIYDGTVGDEVLDEVVALYREIYAEPPYFEGEDDFTSFADDLSRRAEQTSFRLVIARIRSAPLGFALGHQLPASTGWWDGAVPPLSESVTSEHRGRTFAIIELAASKDFRRRGVGRRLHAHLTTDLTEERITLLVRPEASAAQAAYRSWGYTQVGVVQPLPGAPLYDAMVL